MARPTIVIVEPEPHEALSVRKLVIETAKFNVLTAYSADEGVELLKLYPNSDALAVVAEVEDCEKPIKAAREVNPSMAIIVLSPNQTYRCDRSAHQLSSHEPQELLALLRSLFGDPRKAA